MPLISFSCKCNNANFVDSFNVQIPGLDDRLELSQLFGPNVAAYSAYSQQFGFWSYKYFFLSSWNIRRGSKCGEPAQLIFCKIKKKNRKKQHITNLSEANHASVVHKR